MVVGRPHPPLGVDHGGAGRDAGRCRELHHPAGDAVVTGVVAGRDVRVAVVDVDVLIRPGRGQRGVRIACAHATSCCRSKLSDESSTNMCERLGIGLRFDGFSAFHWRCSLGAARGTCRTLASGSRGRPYLRIVARASPRCGPACCVFGERWQLVITGRDHRSCRCSGHPRCPDGHRAGGGPGRQRSSACCHGSESCGAWSA